MKASSDISASLFAKNGVFDPCYTLTAPPANLLVGNNGAAQPPNVKPAACSRPNVKLASRSAGVTLKLDHHDGVAAAALRDHGVRRDVGAGRAHRRGQPLRSE